MSKPEDAPAEYIQIVVRRGHAEEEGHHGGVWKIAYADFMTAMMAFFLVMWLVNAANTEMKSSVASYFNPIKLSDNVIRKKGLLDVDGKANSEETSKTWANTPPGRTDEKLQKGEQVLAGDAGTPDAATDQHGHASAPEQTEEGRGRDGNAGKAGRASEAGRAFRDPFNPFAPGQLMSKEGADTSKGPSADATKQAAATPPAAPASPGSAKTMAPGRLSGAGPDSSTDSAKAAQSARNPGTMGDAGGPTEARELAGGEKSDAAKPDVGRHAASKLDPGKADAATADVAAQPMSGKQLAAAADTVLRDIQTAAKPFVGAGGPGIEVTIEGNGIVLSLTDTSTFGMFPIGSSEPSKQLIDLVGRIAPVLAANSKRIVVRGHTDSRVYRTEKSNNWRLSVSRAEAAYAMLVRSGIDETRFTRIEGYADRKLKVPDDPEAAGNRRIEILLQQVPE